MQPGLRRFVVIPLCVNTVIFAGLIWFGVRQFDRLVNWILFYLPSWLNWFEWLLWPLFALLALMFSFLSFSLITNLIGAPFNGLLSEAIEQHLTGHKVADQGWARTFAQIIPILFTELFKILYFLVWAIPFLIAFLIPGLNLFAPFLWVLFSAWMLALQYCDYPMGNHNLSFTEQRKKLRQKPINSLSFGATTLVATLIPVVNFFVMPAAVAGATIMWIELFNNSLPTEELP